MRGYHGINQEYSTNGAHTQIRDTERRWKLKTQAQARIRRGLG